MNNKLRHRRFEKFIKNIIAGPKLPNDDIILLSAPTAHHPHVGDSYKSVCKAYYNTNAAQPQA